MKRSVLTFLGMALLALAIVPAINLSGFGREGGQGQGKNTEAWWSGSALYNLDFALPFLSRFSYPHGISMNPDQVFIGKEDWLYLGEQYQDALSSGRHAPTGRDALVAGAIGRATDSWSQWLSLKGVRMFRVMLGPDKNTIYPEYLPDWAQPAAGSRTDALLASVSPGLYIDTRAALKEAKSRFGQSLYYKTDTHWNSLGAWIAFRAFEADIARGDPGLRLLTERQVHVSAINHRDGGDLAKFLSLKETLRDSEVVMDILGDHDRPIEIEQYDFETGRLRQSGGNPQIHTARRPLLVKSRHALNEKKVLWLRDSFGTALAPFMAATFTETLQLHYDEADPDRFARLVEAYQPDYVFITVVERAARRKRFGTPAPAVASLENAGNVSAPAESVLPAVRIEPVVLNRGQ